MANATTVTYTDPAAGNVVVSSLDGLVGAQADAAYAGSGSSSVIAALKGIFAQLLTGTVTLGPTTAANSLPVVEAGNLYNHITTATTTNVKSGAGVMHMVTVGTAGTTSTTTIYDNTAASGTIIAVVNSSGTGYWQYDVTFTVGLTVVTTGSPAPDVTVSYH